MRAEIRRPARKPKEVAPAAASHVGWSQEAFASRSGDRGSGAGLPACACDLQGQGL